MKLFTKIYKKSKRSLTLIKLLLAVMLISVGTQVGAINPNKSTNVDPCSDCDGQVTKLELEYLGTGTPNIIVTQKKGGDHNYVIYSGTNVNGPFEFVGADNHDKMGPKIKVYVDDVLNVEIHTSCSVPILVGQTWGDFIIRSGESDNGGPLCAINNSPVAVDDSETTPFNTPVNIDALDNDIEGDGTLDPTSVIFVGGTEPNSATEGLFTVNSTSGLVTFTPVNGFTGQVTIDYEVCDDNNLCDIATITVTVENEIFGPDAINDNATTAFNTPVDIDVLDNDTEGDTALDATSITFISGTVPNPTTIGTFSVHPTTGLVTFTPVSTFAGTAAINYRVCDLNSLCDIAAIVVLVNAAPVGPTAVDDNTTTPINTAVDIIVLANDIQGTAAIDPTTVSFVAGTEPNSGTEGIFYVHPTTGLVTFTPVNGYTGTVTIDYNVCDLNSLCDVGTITVVISGNGPTAVDDNATTPINTAVDIIALANDIQGTAAIDPTTVSFVGGTEPNSGTEGIFTVHPTTGLVTFTPVNGYTGTVTIDYNVCDLNSLCDVATITVVISGNGPTAVDDNVYTALDTPIDIDALDNDIAGGVALDPTSVSFISGTEPNSSTHGTFTVDGAGLVTFTPVTGFTGTATIDYQVCDVNIQCSIATISVTMTTGIDTDGDGCLDDDDEYPEDPDRCFDIYYPANGNGTLAYEDLWPSKGDYDFNDLVVEYRFKTVINGNNNIVETFADFTVRAFGAGFENGFGFQFATDVIADEDILSVTGTDLQEAYVTLEANGIEQGQTKPTIIVYDNSFSIMEHPGQGIGVNTEQWAPYVQPVTINMYISYTQNKYTIAELDLPNFNPFIMVNKDRGVEVHLPNYDPTDLANQWQFGTWDDDSDENAGRYYKTSTNLPWAINIPEPFVWPIEKQDIIWVHLKFAEWAESNGTQFQDWYKDLPGYRNNALIYEQP